MTGASGTLGYNLVRHFAATHPGYRMTALMRTPDPALFAEFAQVELQCVNMLDLQSLVASVQAVKPDVIVHCAASGVRPSNVGWFEQVQVNVAATGALFEAACALASCHFIHVSTGLVYSPQDRPCREGDPIDTLHPYGASKAAADCLLRAGAERLQRHVTVVRPFSFTGLHDAGGRLFPSLLQAASLGEAFAMSSGEQIRDFCAVQDIVEGIAMIVEDRTVRGHRTVNLGSGRSLSVRDIVTSVCRQLELDVSVEFGTKSHHPYEPRYLVADTLVAETLGWRCRTNLAYAVWQLAKRDYPQLHLKEPEQYS